MASSGVTRVVRSSGYAAAATDPYMRHEGASQGKRPRGRGSWRAGGGTIDAEHAGSAPRSNRGNPLARGRNAADSASGAPYGSGAGGRRRGRQPQPPGKQQQGGAGQGGRKPKPSAAPASSGDLNSDLDAYFQGTAGEDGSQAAEGVTKGKAGKAKQPAATVEDLDDMLKAYMGADQADDDAALDSLSPEASAADAEQDTASPNNSKEE